MDRRTERRRAQFSKLKSWQRNRSGNWQIEIRQFRITIFQKPSGWNAVIDHPAMTTAMFTREGSGSFAEAQMAAFDLLTRLEGQIVASTPTPPSPRPA
jgi:hypothetical protein